MCSVAKSITTSISIKKPDSKTSRHAGRSVDLSLLGNGLAGTVGTAAVLYSFKSIAPVVVLAPATRAECGVSSGAAEFGDVAGAAERGLVWIGRWRGAVSGVGCQIWIVGNVHSPPVTRIKSLRTPNKSGLGPGVNGWWG